jgi:hypothetical protein
MRAGSEDDFLPKAQRLLDVLRRLGERHRYLPLVEAVRFVESIYAPFLKEHPREARKAPRTVVPDIVHPNRNRHELIPPSR